MAAAFLLGAALACSEGAEVDPTETTASRADSPSARVRVSGDAPSFIIRSEADEPFGKAPLPEFDPEREGTRSGPAKVLDTANLLVGLDVVPLLGIAGLEGPPMQDLQRWIDEQGGSATCSPDDSQQRYVCHTPGGADVAAAAVELGLARAAQDAPDAYQAREASARESAVGIWAN